MSKRLVTKKLVPLSPLQGQRYDEAPLDGCHPRASAGAGADRLPDSREATFSERRFRHAAGGSRCRETSWGGRSRS